MTTKRQKYWYGQTSNGPTVLSAIKAIRSLAYPGTVLLILHIKSRGSKNLDITLECGTTYITQ